jgi:hypothetical protein
MVKNRVSTRSSSIKFQIGDRSQNPVVQRHDSDLSPFPFTFEFDWVKSGTGRQSLSPFPSPIQVHRKRTERLINPDLENKPPGFGSLQVAGKETGIALILCEVAE